ncbi:sigma-70 family RNA polymerase sigma factor [Pelagibius marinus]|uniref:sigma-70 family RNA polymerase sigma factor n=1 Tax=Pelagibius marinus TaxID=2762760 RepID=UPI00187286E4|nr:sigma-70 family RNA polymerase sigma factor [Pelagibius marinus]
MDLEQSLAREAPGCEDRPPVALAPGHNGVCRAEAAGTAGAAVAADPDPAALLAAIATRRDREAFKQLFAQFAPRVKAFARRSGADGQVAEDLAQDVMLTVWRRAGQYDRDKAAASTWIFTIARNRRIDMLRREARPDFDPQDPSLKAEEGPPADERLHGRRQARALRRAVDRLPEEQAELMRLAYFEDKSHGVIAEELDLPLGTVKSRLRLAMRKLRDMMKDRD